ncbi:hypothetical protein XENOCAPTIV_005164 [Xenoophorus captivus]|uniref:Uncharacterized protein n=1 Tax=Xenoophorus captivus TaxID=1517983 RepID=A0ABV0RKB3_9TELE
MRDLRNGVKLKKVQERLYNPLPIEYQLTPYEMLMDDIRSKRYKLRKVMASARKLKPHPPRPRSLHERLLEDIKAERKLRPVSPDMIRRNRLGTPQRAQQLSQRKRLLKAPTLAELDSSESDPDKHQSLQRRHSVEREAPTFFRAFAPPSRQSSKSLEEFCYPVEYLTLTVEEVMHIRQVLVKAELEKFQQYKEVYNALKKGKLCFACRIKKFSLFTWSYTCQFCKRLSKHSSSKDGQSHDELELPKELTEDWVAMEVCVDCKKFITEIICSNKRSLSVASKRARLNRKTQSFYVASSKLNNFQPAERPINEV